MKLCAEMKKLRDYLDSTCIPWEDKSDTGHLQTERTHFFVKKNGCKWSVIHGFGTYGGWSTYDLIDKGLLELWAEDVNDGEPVGFLTAEEIIRWIELKRRMTEIGTVKNIAVLQRGEQDE